jgi:hypothetical protein
MIAHVMRIEMHLQRTGYGLFAVAEEGRSWGSAEREGDGVVA